MCGSVCVCVCVCVCVYERDGGPGMGGRFVGHEDIQMLLKVEGPSGDTDRCVHGLR